MRRFVASVVTATAIAVVLVASAQAVPPRAGTVGCPPRAPAPVVSEEYRTRVAEALASQTDILGNQVLSRPDGPTYENVKDRLRPAFWAVGPAGWGGALTDSWVHYVPFGQPTGLDTRGQIALHVADGSQITSNKSGFRTMRVYVGRRGEERFGECTAELEEPRLLGGYQPVLEVSYTDHDGIRYRQQSFATFLPGTEILASYVKITANRAGSAQASTRIRFDECCALERSGNRLVADDQTYLYFGPDATFSADGLAYDLNLSDRRDHSVYVVRVNSPVAGAPDVVPGEAAHVAARRASIGYWESRLSQGATFSVPEPLVMDAQRNLLIQNLLMTVRYSIGNQYESFYQPESSDTVETLGRYGFLDVYRASLESLLARSKGPDRRNWEMGEKLLRAADYYWLTGDASFIDANAPFHAGFAADLARQQRRDRNGLLERQRYSSDITRDVYGVHQISRALYGLKAIAAVWHGTDHTDLAARYTRVARALETALERAVRRSSRDLPDGSLFTPAMLLARERPYDPIAATRMGGYWNLVSPYAFASGIYAPGGVRARRTLAYLYGHGSRLLGSLRSRLGAINDVYGVEQAKFLADNDQADQLVLTLYGNLAHGRTRGTFIGGEAANVAPLAHRWPDRIGYCGVGEPCTRPEISAAWSTMDVYRAQYNPPNSANNTLFLSILRSMLVNEVSDDAHIPYGLELAFATPRGWLENGKRIAVRNAPTPFGPVSYTIDSALADNVVAATVEVPSGRTALPLLLKLRVPSSKRIVAVTVNGGAHDRFDPDREIVDLSGLEGELRIRLRYRDAPASAAGTVATLLGVR